MQGSQPGFLLAGRHRGCTSVLFCLSLRAVVWHTLIREATMEENLIVFHIKILCCFINLVFKPSRRYSERVECLFFQERDLCVGRHKCHAALPLRLPFRYHINMDNLKRLQWGRSRVVVLKPYRSFLFSFQTWLPLWISQVTPSGGSSGFVFLRKAAGSLLTTPTPTRSACLTADAHGNANTHSGIC